MNAYLFPPRPCAPTTLYRVRARAGRAVSGILGAVLGVFLFASACGPHRPDPAVAVYGAELAACVDTSSTWTDYQVCKARVNARWGRPVRP